MKDPTEIQLSKSPVDKMLSDKPNSEISESEQSIPTNQNSETDNVQSNQNIEENSNTDNEKEKNETDIDSKYKEKKNSYDNSLEATSESEKKDTSNVSKKKEDEAHSNKMKKEVKTNTDSKVEGNKTKNVGNDKLAQLDNKHITQIEKVDSDEKLLTDSQHKNKSIQNNDKKMEEKNLINDQEKKTIIAIENEKHEVEGQFKNDKEENDEAHTDGQKIVDRVQNDDKKKRLKLQSNGQSNENRSDEKKEEEKLITHKENKEDRVLDKKKKVLIDSQNEGILHVKDKNEEVQDQTNSQKKKLKAHTPELSNDSSCSIELSSVFIENKSKNIRTVISESTSEESDDEDFDDQSSDEDSEDSKQIISDAVSINSDSDQSDIVLVEDQTKLFNGSNGTRSSDVLEISDGEDCVVTGVKKSTFGLNRRRKKRKRNNKTGLINNAFVGEVESIEDESDVEVIPIEDPLEEQAKNSQNINKTLLKDPIPICTNNKKIENDKNEKEMSPLHNKPNSENTKETADLCQSITARGITITPVGNKSSPITQNIRQNEPILPTLTDDMFVVEVPSFIIPYVYEKPSLKPFREFVDVLGKELEDQKKARELEKEKIKNAAIECSEKMKDSEGETGRGTKRKTEDNEGNDKKQKKGQRQRKKKDDDDASWDELSTSDDSDDHTLSGDDITKGIIDMDDTLGIGVNNLQSPNKTTTTYFDYGIGKLLINIGGSLVQEFVQNDLLKQQTRKLARERRTGQTTQATTSSIHSLNSNLKLSKEKNEPFTFIQKKCRFCTFKTESKIVLAHHLEVPHMKNNLYQCNYCSYEVRSPHDILVHMKIEHHVNGRLERALGTHQCVNCPYEDNGKAKMARHVVACTKKFKPNFNLTPSLDWEFPAKLPKQTKSRVHSNVMPRNTVRNRQMAVPRNVPVANVSNQGQTFIPRIGMQGTTTVRGPTITQINQPPKNTVLKLPAQHPSLSITPLSRGPAPGPATGPATGPLGKTNFVICEMCDSYIKDLEQLRNHMQWIHKVKIHPKMIQNRPPLNCQKCQFRFFTDHGLERHLLGSHGLVPSSMQEAANKGKDAGRCPICGRVFQWKLLTHVARDHKVALKPAHLSYKCTVCTSTFSLYKQFEEHVYSLHRVAAKKVAEDVKQGKTIQNPAKVAAPVKPSGLTITAVTKRN